MDENQLNQQKIKEAWKTMTPGKKIEYLWMYYKSWLFAAILLVGVICLGVTMYRGTHTKVLLDIVVVGGNNQKAEWLGESFAEYMDVKEEDGLLRVRSNIPVESDKGTVDSKTALTTLIGAEEVGVLVCTESMYENYQGQEAFYRIEEVLGEKAESYGEAALEYGIVLKPDNILESEGMVGYDPVYVAVPVTSKNPEMAARFIEYLCQ